MTRTSRPSRRFRSVLAGVSAAIAALAMVPFARAMPLPTAGIVGTAGAPHTPEVRAAAAYVMDRDTGEALFARYPSLRRSVASTTKLMTGLLAAESGRLDDSFAVSASAVSVGETSMLAVAGERLTLRELAYGLMLPSGNDAAVAIAEALDGSVAAFSDRMNRRAHELGMWDSQFANPHGLDHERFFRPDHFSTARDMAVLGSAVGDNPEIRRIAGTRSFDVPARDGRPARTLRNTLGALWWYPGLVAGKTGWTERAGQCRVAIADRAGMRLSVALLGSPDDVRELRDLLDYGFATLQSRRPLAGVPVVPRHADDLPSPAPALVDAWERFYATFVTRAGMVQVAAGRDEGSSALQGDAMLQAVWFRDREAFDRLWDWTRTRLERSQAGGSPHVRDALYAREWAGARVTNWGPDTGADQRIAGALLLASRTWREPAYAAAASDTLAAVLEKSAISSNRLGIAYEPTLTAAGDGTVVTSARSIVPALMRAFAEGARQGVWHWLVDGTYAVLGRAASPDSVTRRADVPAGTWPSAFAVSRQGLALGRAPGDRFGRDAAALVAQVAIEARWQAETGAGVERADHPARLATAAARGISVAPVAWTTASGPGELLSSGTRSLLACIALVDASISPRAAPAVDEALRSADAATVLDGLTGRWCLDGGPPDLWRTYSEPPSLPTSRNDAVVPPAAPGAWFHDDDTGHVVSGPFAAYVAAVGGLEVLGPPLTDAIHLDGRRVQYFRDAILEEVASPLGFRVTPFGAGRARAEIDGVLSRPEAGRLQVGAPLEGKRLLGTSGHAVGGAFAKALDALPGLAALLGDPITEEVEVAGTVVQYFVAGRLEYVPGRPALAGQPVRLTPVGAVAARERGWLVDVR